MRCRIPMVIDLFAGAGLFSNAFAKEGFEIILAVEIDPIAARTYAYNVGNHIENIDINHKKPCGNCDVLIAGPPCQGFSTLGKRVPNDPRNNLSLYVLRWARATNPAVVVIENVEAFLKAPIWVKLFRSLRKMGYDVTGQVLNSYDFGVPQNRRRSFTIASKIGMPRLYAIKSDPVQTVRKALEGLPHKPDGRNHHYAPRPSQLALARMKVIGKGGDKRDIMRKSPELAVSSWWCLGEQATDVWGRMEWDKPCNTLRTCFQNPSKGRYIHPTQNRVISLREAARLHSIDDRWSFFSSPYQIARQIGNSVPPNLGKAIARAVRRLF